MADTRPSLDSERDEQSWRSRPPLMRHAEATLTRARQVNTEAGKATARAAADLHTHRPSRRLLAEFTPRPTLPRRPHTPAPTARSNITAPHSGPPAAAPRALTPSGGPQPHPRPPHTPGRRRSGRPRTLKPARLARSTPGHATPADLGTPTSPAQATPIPGGPPSRPRKPTHRPYYAVRAVGGATSTLPGQRQTRRLRRGHLLTAGQGEALLAARLPGI